MSKPTDYADFATDTNFTNGPDVGTATKTTPSSGELAEGNIRGTAPSAQKANWWQHVVGLWVRWFDTVLSPLADIAALKALTTPADGDVRNVDGHGMFVFRTAETSPYSPFRVAADDATPGGWIGSAAHALVPSPALNFPVRVTAALAEHVKFDPFTRNWYASDKDANDKFIRTVNPYVWPSSTELSGGLAHTLPVYDFAFDGAGGIVAWSTANDACWTYNGSSWTKRSGLIGNDAEKPAIAYEPVAGLFVYASLTSGGGSTDWATSSDGGATWTGRTAPSGWPTASAITLAVGAGVVLAQALEGTNMYTSVSTDGGVTWAAAVVTATGLAAPSLARMPSPVWTGSRFVVAALDTGAPGTKFYESADGASWSLLSTITSMAIVTFNSMGDRLFVASDNGVDNPIVLSSDGGATWYYGPRGEEANVIESIASSPVQFVISLSSGEVMPGAAVGVGVKQVS